jgi:hypothetical protein
MPIMMLMEWAGVTKAQYDEVKRITNFEHDAPGGGWFHVAAVDDHGLRVCDVWDSAEDFGKFVETRLKPATMQAGIKGEPKVMIVPAHNVYAPGYTPHKR